MNAIKMTPATVLTFIHANAALAYAMVWRVLGASADKCRIEDVWSMIELDVAEKVAASFDASKGVKFSTYLSTCIRNATINYVSQASERSTSLDATIGEDDERPAFEMTYANMLGNRTSNEFRCNPEEYTILRDGVIKIVAVLGTLSEDERAMILGMFDPEFSVADYAASRGVAAGTVYSWKSRAIAAMEAAFKGECPV